MPRPLVTLVACIALVVVCAGAASAYDTIFISSTAANEVYRYQIYPTGTPVLELTLTANLDRPAYLALNPSQSELFIVNRGNPAGGAGSIARYLDPNGSPIANGTIADVNNGGGFDFNLPHDLAFRGNELFVVNSDADNVLRFLFDGAGVPSSNGTISLSPIGQNLRGIVVGPGGNLYLTVANTTSQQVREFLFDGGGNASPGQVISTPGSNDHGMAFSPWGELFVTEAGSNSIARFTFDGGGVAQANGQITGNGLTSPVDLTFSGWGELFVGNSLGPIVSRWLFTGAHVAVANGSFATPHPVGALQFGKRTITGVGTGDSPALWSSAPYPNPTAHGARVDFSMPAHSRVSADVFDCNGRRVRALMSDADLTAGHHTLSWDGNDARGHSSASGVYFIRFRSAQQSWSERVVVVR